MNYVPKLQPYEHQKRALDFLDGRKAGALFMVMRTGKTKCILDDFGRLQNRGEVDDLLVIAPAGVYRTWVTAIRDHVGSPLEENLLTFVWSAAERSPSYRARLAAFLSERGPRALLINVEALSSVERAREVCLRFLNQSRRVMGVVDESTVIKSPTAARTKFINKEIAPRLAFRRILSGLPTPQSPLDAYSQFEFLGRELLGFPSFWSFRARYAIIRKMQIGGRSIDIIDGYRDEDELALRMAPHRFRVLLSECYDLPPKVYQIHEVELTPEQKRLYQEVKQYATTELAEGAGHVTATMVMVQLLRLHQILCGHATDEEGRVHEIENKRVKSLLEVLQFHVGKTVIWCSYDYDIRAVSEALLKEYGPRSVARFWGGNRSTREEEELRFQTDPDCLFMVATAAAGGRGRMWAIADLVIYYSNTPNLEHRSQSEERTQAIDKSNSVLYIDLVVPDSVDMKFLKALRNKINMAATLNGDNWMEWIV